ncbi:MAG: hypothetical protein U9N86_16170 [Bacteroidota bacterium]|nr:hypothetical protein [Bacteroidota bacterium]
MKRSLIQTLLVAGLIFLTTGLTAQEITSELFSQLRYRHIGPPGNRTSAVVGVPGNDMVSYIGASSGGIWKTTDRGGRWFPIFDEMEAQSIGAIAIAPSDPNVVWTGTGEAFIRSNVSIGNGVYKSSDGGDTWKKLEGNGLPSRPIGKVGIAIANSNPDVVFAMMETGAPNKGVLWKSTDGGNRWRLISKDRLLNERPHYASRIMVNPADENLVYFAANSHSISYDGGVTTERSGWSGDTHDMWADPMNPDRIMISDDGVAIMSFNRGVSWSRVKLPIAQMYNVAVDNQIPYNVYGGKQDGPGYKGTSMSRGSDSDWASTAGGECGFIVPDPVDPNIVWGGSYVGQFTRVDYRTGHNRTVMVWPESTYGAAGKDAKYRVNWTFPIEISPHDHNTIYVGSQYVHKTSDEGQSWEIISPDLSTNNPDWLQPSGGLTKDNIGGG